MKLRWGGVAAALVATVASPQQAEAFGRRCAPQQVCQPVCQTAQYKWVWEQVQREVLVPVLDKDGKPILDETGKPKMEKKMVTEVVPRLVPIQSAGVAETFVPTTGTGGSVAEQIQKIRETLGDRRPDQNSLEADIKRIRELLEKLEKEKSSKP
jgi:hypothetical protein